MKPRLEAVDSLRGLALLSMILYHGMWDLVFLFGVKLSWYLGTPGMLWQQSICWTFIFLAGFSWQLGRRPGKRGLTVLAGGAVISLISALVGQPIRFGILTLLGSCTLLWIPLHRLFSRVAPEWGAGSFFLLFLLARKLWELYDPRTSAAWIPEAIRSDLALAYLGFPQPGFSSADYFPLLPWILLFGTGYFLFSLLKKYGLLRKFLEKGRIPGVSFLGKNSLLVYLLHQPVLYGLCFLGILIFT